MKLNKHLKVNLKIMMTHQCATLSTRFNVKDLTDFEYKSEFVYCIKYSKNDIIIMIVIVK